MKELIFSIRSGTVVISDPAYRRDGKMVFFQISRSGLRKGQWVAAAITEDSRTYLQARHCDIVRRPLRLKWEELDGDLKSDSGLLGIFDVYEFKAESSAWLRKCCELTGESSVGILPKGCVHNVVRFDGYASYLAKDPGPGDVVALKVAL
jgi:hypothetical protein